MLSLFLKDLQWTHQREENGPSQSERWLKHFCEPLYEKERTKVFSNLNPKERKPLFFCWEKKEWKQVQRKKFPKNPISCFFFRYKIQHRPPTRREPRILSIVFSIEQVPPGVPTWWTRLFLSCLPPSRVRRGAAGRREKKEQASTFFFVRVCQIFYSTWNLKWWSGDSPSQVEKEINFFLTFHCTYILKKETRF